MTAEVDRAVWNYYMPDEEPEDPGRPLMHAPGFVVAAAVELIDLGVKPDGSDIPEVAARIDYKYLNGTLNW